MAKQPKWKAKQKKQSERNARRDQARQEAFDDAAMQIIYYPPTLIDEMCAPDKNTVIFKGMTPKIAEYLMPETQEITLFPLSDFYTEIPINGKVLKIRWVPFESPVSPSATFRYCRKTTEDYFKNEVARQNSPIDAKAELKRIFDFSSYSAEDAFATLYVRYGDVYAMGFIYRNKDGKSIYLSPYHISLVELRTKDAQLYIECDTALQYLKKYVYVIQHLVALYLTGEEIPAIPASIAGIKPVDILPRPDGGDHSYRRPKHECAGQPKCIAYIRYDAIGAKVRISNSSRDYSMNWWIVSGHLRHYTDGKVVEIPPYIKGDKECPEAQRALEEFKQGFDRIKYYHLVARRAK